MFRRRGKEPMKAIRQTRPRPSPRLLQSLEQARDCCRNLATLAAFLEICGEAEEGMLEREAVGRAGGMISEEVRRLNQLLFTLHRRGWPHSGPRQ